MTVTDRKPNEYLSHWYHVFPGLGITPQAFYDEIEKRIREHEFPLVYLGRVEFRESGLLSVKRLYLRVVRGDLAFDLCGAPFGNQLFFASCWLGRLGMSGCGSVALGCLAMLPGIGLLAERSLRPMTCYEIDSAQVFQDAIMGIVQGHLDELCGNANVPTLTDAQRAVSMKRLIDP